MVICRNQLVPPVSQRHRLVERDMKILQAHDVRPAERRINHFIVEHRQTNLPCEYDVPAMTIQTAVQHLLRQGLWPAAETS